MLFVIVLVLVNILFFLPIYLMNVQLNPNPFPAFQPLLKKGISAKARFRPIHMRFSSDPVRIHFEFTALVILAALFSLGAWSHVLIGLLGGIGWLILLYSALMIYVFNRSPVIRSDWRLLKTGFSIAHQYRFLVYPTLIVAVLVLIAINYFLAKIILTHFPSDPFWLSGFLIVCMVFSFHKIRSASYQSLQHRVFQSSFGYLYRNIRIKENTEELLKLSEDFFHQKNVYSHLQLAKKPNIRMVCLESYGAFSFQDPELLAHLQPVYQALERVSSQKKLSVATALSEAPIFSGGSWISYCSFLYGVNFENNFKYEALFGKDSNFQYYDSLLHFLRKSGYRNYLICPLHVYHGETIDWEQLANTLQVDQFLDWKTIAYQGDPVPFCKVRKSPPDQYAMNRSEAIMKTDGITPNLSFFCTLNSHYPYDSPSEIESDWKSLNDKGTLQLFRSKDQRSRYFQAIRYQLKVVCDYLSRQPEEEPFIYILFGDHQPPVVASTELGTATPVHIVCTDETLLTPFLDKGFKPGWLPPEDNTPRIRHEGFFSLFMQGLNKAYGSDPTLNLPYFAEGHPLKAYD